MKYLLPILALGLIFPVTAGEYNVDAGHSFVIFKVSHLNMSTAIGQFRKIEGSVDLENGKLDIKILISSVDTNDKKRTEHLLGTDS